MAVIAEFYSGINLMIKLNVTMPNDHYASAVKRENGVNITDRRTVDFLDF